MIPLKGTLMFPISDNTKIRHMLVYGRGRQNPWDPLVIFEEAMYWPHRFSSSTSVHESVI